MFYKSLTKIEGTFFRLLSSYLTNNENNKKGENAKRGIEMYASNMFSKRRPSGWTERRRRFERLIEQARAKAGKPDREQDTSERPKR